MYGINSASLIRQEKEMTNQSAFFDRKTFFSVCLFVVFFSVLVTFLFRTNHDHTLITAINHNNSCIYDDLKDAIHRALFCLFYIVSWFLCTNEYWTCVLIYSCAFKSVGSWEYFNKNSQLMFTWSRHVARRHFVNVRGILEVKKRRFCSLHFNEKSKGNQMQIAFLALILWFPVMYKTNATVLWHFKFRNGF